MEFSVRNFYSIALDIFGTNFNNIYISNMQQSIPIQSCNDAMDELIFSNHYLHYTHKHKLMFFNTLYPA